MVSIYRPVKTNGNMSSQGQLRSARSQDKAHVDTIYLALF
jgi:hypothetical protein